MRAIADYELKNFSFEWPKSDKAKYMYKFEGNIEELCLNLYWPLKRRDILIESAEPEENGDDEADVEMNEAEREQLTRTKEAKQRMW